MSKGNREEGRRTGVESEQRCLSGKMGEGEGVSVVKGRPEVKKRQANSMCGGMRKGPWLSDGMCTERTNAAGLSIVKVSFHGQNTENTHEGSVRVKRRVAEGRMEHFAEGSTRYRWSELESEVM